MNKNSINDIAYSIGESCPEGAMTIGPDGQPRITYHGLGIVLADMAKDEFPSLAAAIAGVAGGCANVYLQLLEQGHDIRSARHGADAVLASAKLRLEEAFRGTGHQGGRA